MSGNDRRQRLSECRHRMGGPMHDETWPKDWIDPSTGERMTTMGKHRSGPYAKPLRYYEYDENAELECWNCAWRGRAREGSRETYDELFDVSCPRCETMLLVVSVVLTLE